MRSESKKIIPALEFEKEFQSDSQSPEKDVRGTYLRWVALILASLLVPGNDYCYDLPQALQTQIQETLGVGELKYNLLYSLYSFPNIILPFIGGLVLDYFGINVGLILYNILIILGQSFYTFGSYGHDFNLMVLGRVIIGVGSESLNVAQSTLLTMWFKGREQTFALGVSLCVARIGSATNSSITPMIYNATKSLGFCSLIGLFCVIGSAIPGLILVCMQRKYLSKLSLGSDKISIRDIKSFNLSVWLLFFNAIICFQSYFSFFNIANKYFQIRFNFSKVEAGKLLVIPYIISGILTPSCSWIIDRVGKRASLMIFSCSLLALIHLFFGLIPDCEQCMVALGGLVLMGVFFGLHLSLLIPSAFIIVDQKVMGSALGFITSGQNTGLAIGPLLVGRILNSKKDQESLKEGYHTLSLFLFGISALALINAIINYWWDAKRNNSKLETFRIGMPDENEFVEDEEAPKRETPEQTIEVEGLDDSSEVNKQEREDLLPEDDSRVFT